MPAVPLQLFAQRPERRKHRLVHELAPADGRHRLLRVFLALAAFLSLKVVGEDDSPVSDAGAHDHPPPGPRPRSRSWRAPRALACPRCPHEPLAAAIRATV